MQFEAAWVLSNIASGASNHCHLLHAFGATPLLTQLLECDDPDCCEQVSGTLLCLL